MSKRVMDQFEETVVNQNISLNNFEVKIRAHEGSEVKPEVLSKRLNTKPKKSSNSNKALLLLAILSAIFIYQITVLL